MKSNPIPSFLLKLMIVTIVSCDTKDPAPAPTADFTFSIEANGTALFTSTSLNVSSFSWEFGDSTSSTEESPSHTYVKNATYTVKLTVKGSGGTAETTQAVEITNRLNAQGCLPVMISECPSTDAVTDPAQALNLLYGTWNWQSRFETWPYNNVRTITPYPDHCNMTVLFKDDQTYELWIGDLLKASGNYAVDKVDITMSDQFMLSYGGPNLVHEFRMHLTVGPDPKITEYSGPPKYFLAFYLSGLLSVSSDGTCLQLGVWSRDIHGFVYTSGNKFIKG